MNKKEAIKEMLNGKVIWVGGKNLLKFWDEMFLISQDLGVTYFGCDINEIESDNGYSVFVEKITATIKELEDCFYIATNSSRDNGWANVSCEKFIKELKGLKK